MARWAFIAETVEGEEIGELMGARDRKLSFDLRGPASATFTLDGLDPLAFAMDELATDLYCWRDQTLMFRGRMGSTDDALDSDKHETSWSAVDYRGMLARRTDHDGHKYDNVEQTQIAWNLVDVAQSGIAGSLGITRGQRPPTSNYVNRTVKIEADTTILDALDSNSQDFEDGFEYWIDEHRVLNCAQWRGVAHDDFPLIWGVTASSIKRTFDTSLYANWCRVRGGQPDGKVNQPAPVADRFASNLQTLREGRIETVVQNTDLTTQAAVDAAAGALLKDSLHPPAAYAADLMHGVWTGWADLWLGDTLTLVVRSGRLDFAKTARVSQIDIAISEEGDEILTLTVSSE